MRLRTFLAFLIVSALANMAEAQTKISGTSQCAKPDPMHALEVGDRAGHSLTVSQSKCTWTKPMDIAGTQTKEDVVTASDDMRGNRSRSHGYVVGTVANGDKMFVRFEGSASLKDGKPETAEGKWSYTGGTGKLKGIKGQGTYKGKASADGGITYEVEGEYQLPK